MKKLLISTLMGLTLLSAENNVTKTSELELFLFKIGFNALLNDVDRQKGDINLNKEEIKVLQDKMKILFDEYNKKSFENNIKESIVIKDDNEDISKLKEELLLLRDEIKTLKKELQEVKTTKQEIVVIEKKTEVIPKKLEVEEIKNSIKAVVLKKELRVKNRPYLDAKTIKSYYRGDILQIESCNKYQWCKVENKEEYLAKYFLQFK